MERETSDLKSGRDSKALCVKAMDTSINTIVYCAKGYCKENNSCLKISEYDFQDLDMTENRKKCLVIFNQKIYFLFCLK